MPFEPPPRGSLLRRRRENVVILARTVSVPLGGRRKKALRRNPAGRVPRLALQELGVAGTEKVTSTKYGKTGESG